MVNNYYKVTRWNGTKPDARYFEFDSSDDVAEARVNNAATTVARNWGGALSCYKSTHRGHSVIGTTPANSRLDVLEGAENN